MATGDKKGNPNARFKKIDARVFELSNFSGELREFPHKYREGELPYRVLRNPKIDYFIELHDKILELFEAENPNEFIRKHYDADMC